MSGRELSAPAPAGMASPASPRPRPRAADVRACRAIIRAHARSFSFASAFLPRAVRGDVAVVYAYYRHLDDLVDCTPPGMGVEAVRAALDAWEGWLSAGAPYDAGHPVTRALPAVMARRGIHPAELGVVVRGLRSDLDHRRPATMADLEAYAFDVAGSVGLVMATLLGAADPVGSRPAAAALGTAMQLTNVCRDVAEDLDRGRLYLPLEVCAAVGCDAAALLERRSTPAVRAAVGTVAARARELYAEGVAGLRHLPAETRFPIAVAARAYAGILDRLADRDHEVFAGRVATTRRTRWGIVARLAAGRALRV